MELSLPPTDEILEMDEKGFKDKFGEVKFLNITRNITKRKLVEKKRKQAERELVQKRKLAAVGQLAAGIAHQLNTPLANISLTNVYIQSLIKSTNIKESQVEIQELIQENTNQINFCAKIVKELLQFSRKTELILKPIFIHSIITNTLNSPVIGSRLNKLDIKLDLEINTNLQILGDVELLTQVFQNLIGNAIDAIEHIKMPILKIITKQEDTKIAILIIDNGIGIKEKDLPRVFEPFFTTKPVTKGTGLGLAISKSIIEKHGGEIKIISLYNEGTTIKLVLSLYESQLN